MADFYQTRIAELAPGYSPRLVEAWMRLERGTLDALTPTQFRAEVGMACACIDEADAEQSEALARSFGL